ncbi:hypothetical protein L9F63_003204 [Diploptera punctata]|uniref:Uncharacterized protein n=1 Tax=Diploptera punctata TaxID=6984 RepID=A0AAD7ZLE9_DIPPU|nr:hypothetical protein L9F63_003204 [Diploptera punctata]
MSFKRAASTEVNHYEIGEPPAKLPNYNFFYTLESESEKGSSDDDSESVRSDQGKETEYAKDTSDTTTHSDCSSEEDFTVKVEYEVESLSEKENPLGNSSLSSDTDDVMYTVVTKVNVDKDELSTLADSSGNSDSNVIFDPEIPRADYWTCLNCKNQNNNPNFRYCEKCYKLKKDFFPPRPRRRRKRRNSNKKSSLEKSISTASTISVSSQDTLSAIAGPSHMDSGIGSSQDFLSQSEMDSQEIASNSTDSLSSQLCITCMTNQKNGIFVHGKVGHVCCCYKCALKVWTQTGKCPICNGKVRSVLKVIVH